MARCFVTRSIPGPALERLAAEHEVDVWPGRLMPKRSQLLARAAEADGLLSMLTDRIDRDLIEACPRLVAISNYAVGWDNVDIAAASARGIPVGHTPDVLTETTADFAFALMLAAARRVVEADAHVRRGAWMTWEPGLLLGHDVHGATLGIVGMGRIGSAVARRAEGFGMKVIHTGREGGVPLAELCGRSDFVSLHVPLTPETRGLIGEAELRAMRPTAILVNTARGPVVDPAALGRALRGGWIAGAALDVTDPEPLPASHPLLEAPGLVVAPHVASASHGARAAMAERAVDNLLSGLRGDPMPHCVNPKAHGQARDEG
ncbi:MAG TPA: D-glycerate dehydrogenase [Thermoleophilaceae bacterium]|nr:D-glycerate dehydrogenase [Thermoleophilaceae bacterium]